MIDFKKGDLVELPTGKLGRIKKLYPTFAMITLNPEFVEIPKIRSWKPISSRICKYEKLKIPSE